MSFIFIVVSLVLFACPIQSTDNRLQVVKEEELKILIQEEKFIVILFSENPECTGKCELLESSLVSVREDMVEDTGAWVVRSHSTALASSFGVKDSSIIFVRNGRPLLYTGPSTNDEVLLQYILENKKPLAINLTDSNFEHETQAGTGATTGDWLVMFTKSDCSECLEYIAIFEAVGASLRGVKNIAFVDREHGSATARRFGVKRFPTFLLFRFGKMYSFASPVIDVESLTSFAKSGFKSTQGTDVPAPKDPLEDMTEAATDWLRENPGSVFLCVGGVVLIGAFLYVLNRPPPESWIKKNNKKKKMK